MDINFDVLQISLSKQKIWLVKFCYFGLKKCLQNTNQKFIIWNEVKTRYKPKGGGPGGPQGSQTSLVYPRGPKNPLFPALNLIILSYSPGIPVTYR